MEQSCSSHGRQEAKREIERERERKFFRNKKYPSKVHPVVTYFFQTDLIS
jgi:hypothetical protein